MTEKYEKQHNDWQLWLGNTQDSTYWMTDSQQIQQSTKTVKLSDYYNLMNWYKHRCQSVTKGCNRQAIDKDFKHRRQVAASHAAIS